MPVPFDRRRQRDPDPERWGVWTGCDRELWAWASLHRTARLIGIVARARAGESGAALELAESAWYRHQGFAAVRPAPGRRFVRVSIHDLKFRAVLALIASDRAYVPKEGAVQPRPDDVERPLARRLAAECPHRLIDDVGPVDVGAGPGNGSARAERTRQLGAVLDVAGLGLPDSLSVALLRHAYACPVQENRFARVMEWLEDQFPGLAEFRTDDLADRLAAMAGTPTAEVERSREDIIHLRTWSISERRRLERLAAQNPEFEPCYQFFRERGIENPTRNDVLEHRGLTVGDRPSPRGGPGAVRQWQVLGTVDEIAAEVVFSLARAGYAVLATVGEEFLVDTSDATDKVEHVRSVVKEQTKRMLWAAAPVEAEYCEGW